MASARRQAARDGRSKIHNPKSTIEVLLAAVHLSPALTVPIAIALSAVFVWYWIRLGRGDVPVSRRKIRRFSLAVMLIALPMFVRAASFVDPAIDKKPYVLAWTAATLMVLLVIVSALLDAANNLRLHQRLQHEEMIKAATELAKTIRERERVEGRGSNNADGERA